MEKLTITISKDKEVHHFQVGEYPHHDAQRCRYRVFENGEFVASFEPDSNNYLHICQNPVDLYEEVLHQLADQIEAMIPHAESKHFNNEEL